MRLQALVKLVSFSLDNHRRSQAVATFPVDEE